MSWITHTDIANFTGRSYSTAEQAELDRLCLAVQEAFKKETGRDFVETAGDDYTEYFTGEDVYEFHLKSTPASDVVSVEIYNSVNKTYEAYSYNYYLVEGRKVVLQTLVGTGVPNEIKIVYKGATVPADVKQALIEWVLLIWNARHDAGQIPQAKSQGTKRVDYLVIDNLPANIKSVIDRYKILNI